MIFFKNMEDKTIINIDIISYISKYSTDIYTIRFITTNKCYHINKKTFDKIINIMDNKFMINENTVINVKNILYIHKNNIVFIGDSSSDTLDIFEEEYEKLSDYLFNN